MGEYANKGVNRRWSYAVCGFLLGILAPIGWASLRLLLFWHPEQTLWRQVTGDVLASVHNQVLYGYMGGGTAVVLSAFGFLIGRASQQIHERAHRLDELNGVVARQKEAFEIRFRDLNASLKHFHAINAHIQRSVDRGEVLRLAADGLHEILGYDRVNLLMVNGAGDALEFAACRGSEKAAVQSHSIALDMRAGALFKAVCDNSVLLVDDVGSMPEGYRLEPPWDALPQLRSRSFILCPIVEREGVVGLFGVDNKLRRKGLDGTDVDTVKLFADQVSAALTKIGLLEAVDTLTRELDGTFRELLKYREEHAGLDRSLKEATASTAEATAEIADASDVVREAVDATRSAAGEISVSIEQVSQNLQQLTTYMDGAVPAMAGIASTIRSVEENGARSHVLSERVKEQAESGSAAVGDVLRGLLGVGEAVDGAVATIDRLSRKGEEIDSITAVIAEITQKTNLLALNAAIIAAQAGEHGRSFAVVADEVRSLSQETSQSTEAIGQIIDEMQAYTRETGEHFDRTRQLVQEGIGLGRGMEASLREILKSAVAAMEMARDIRKDIRETTRSVESVSRSIDEIGEMAVQISMASVEETSGIRSIVRSIEDVKRMADGMVVATSRQRQHTGEIEGAVASVSAMAGTIFSAMEERQRGSREVIERLERLRKG